MNRRMKMARGMKRGRKVQGFSEYCEKTQERINELKATLKIDSTSEEQKKQIRNQISAFQARLKQRITNMDQELCLEQKNQQISTVLKIISEYVDQS
jgi:flagellin-specific chaperone FliS